MKTHAMKLPCTDFVLMLMPEKVWNCAVIKSAALCVSAVCSPALCHFVAEFLWFPKCFHLFNNATYTWLWTILERGNFNNRLIAKVASYYSTTLKLNEPFFQTTAPMTSKKILNLHFKQQDSFLFHLLNRQYERKSFLLYIGFRLAWSHFNLHLCSLTVVFKSIPQLIQWFPHHCMSWRGYRSRPRSNDFHPSPLRIEMSHYSLNLLMVLCAVMMKSWNPLQFWCWKTVLNWQLFAKYLLFHSDKSFYILLLLKE